MEIDPVNKALVGGFFVIAGLVTLIFHKDAKAFHDDWFGVISQYFPLYPRGKALTVITIVFGVLSVIGGGLVLLLALGPV